MKQKYALEENEKRARAAGISLPISIKHSVEVCSFIRNKKLESAMEQLREVVAGKRAVPYKRYNRDLAHKKGMAAGRYPKKTCLEIIKILESVKANAEEKGLGENLVIKHVSANKASTPWRYGRHRRRKAKRTHITVVVEEFEERREKKEVLKKKKQEKTEKKIEKKKEEKKHVKAIDVADNKNKKIKDNNKNDKNKKPITKNQDAKND